MQIHRFKIKRILFLIIFALVACSLLGQISRFYLDHDRLFGFVILFNVDEEHNIPSYFSSILLLSAAGLLAIVASITSQQQAFNPRPWRFLSFIFVLLSLDEMIALHEQMRVWFLVGQFESSAWCFWFALTILPVGLYYLKFLNTFSPEVKRRIIFSGIIYVVSAIGGDAVDLFVRVETHNSELTFSRVLLKTAEESGEMIGVTLFLDALLYFIQTSIHTITLTIND